MIRAYIGLGSNLSAPVEQIQSAIGALESLEKSQFVVCSSLYASKPMGPQSQPDYVNAVACIETSLSAPQLLRRLQQIENSQGRVRDGERWGPRTLDLDIILFGEQVINQADLVVPHYGMKEREFVLYPLLEIAPQLVLPCGQPLQQLIRAVEPNELTVVG